MPKKQIPLREGYSIKLNTKIFDLADRIIASFTEEEQIHLKEIGEINDIRTKLYNIFEKYCKLEEGQPFLEIHEEDKIDLFSEMDKSVEEYSKNTIEYNEPMFVDTLGEYVFRYWESCVL